MSIQNIFNTHGISSVERITEHVAFLLLVQEDWDSIRALTGEPLKNALEEKFASLSNNHPDLIIPQPPPAAQWKNDTLDALIREIEDSIWQWENEHIQTNLLPLFEELTQDWSNEVRQQRREALQNIITQARRRSTYRDRLGSIQEMIESWADPSAPQALKDSLQFLISQSGESLSRYFQRNIRWDLLKSTSGSQYPTPYHIANLMAALAVDRPNADILDPAMGSAGLMIAALKIAPDANLAGADYDPTWAGIGSANLILHGKGDTSVHLGSALAMFNDWQGQFDTVLVNPPFDDNRAAGEVAETVGEQYGRSNPTVFGALALQTLRPGGHASFLTPSGMLFARRGAEMNLKTMLLGEELEAIITLSKRAFYPFSNVDAHLIVIRKQEEDTPSPENPVWFCHIESDGYEEGAKRDLSAPIRPEINEIPRVQSLILKTRQPDAWQTHFHIDSVGVVQTTRLSSPDGLPGMGIRVETTPKWELAALTNGSLIKIKDQQEHILAWLSVPYEDREAIAITRDQFASVAWVNQINRGDWTADVVGQYQNETAESMLQIEAGEQLSFTLSHGRSKYIFDEGDNQTEAACLLDENGRALTPWLHQRVASNIRDKDFGEKFSAISLQDASEAQMGWLLEFTYSNAENGTPRDIYLLIGFQDTVNLFEYGNGVYGFADQGYFQISREDSALHFERGQSLSHRTGINVIGLAIGPSAEAQRQRIFAVLRERDTFNSSDDLQPNQFLPEAEAPTSLNPATILASLRKNQTRLNAKVNNLLEILGDGSQQKNFSNQAYPIPDWITVLLDVQQKACWDTIASHTVDERPVHFNIKDLLIWKNETDTNFTYNDADALMQMELFLRMGLIIRVHDKNENYYRCLTYQDVLKPQTQNEESDHEGA